MNTSNESIQKFKNELKTFNEWKINSLLTNSWARFGAFVHQSVAHWPGVGDPCDSNCPVT